MNLLIQKEYDSIYRITEMSFSDKPIYQPPSKNILVTGLELPILRKILKNIQKNKKII